MSQAMIKYKHLDNGWQIKNIEGFVYVDEAKGIRFKT
jgi:hypothetical protein